MLGQILRQRYKILRQLGEGGFGKTFLAEDLDMPVNPKPKCVVKQLHPQMLDPAMVRRFEKEGEILYRLGQQNPQIPDVYAYFQENGEFYLIQEFIEGHNLEEEIGTGKRWTEAQTRTFLQEVLEILAFVHKNQVIHRDIKPSNIMRRDRDGKLVLIDFGIVKEIVQGGADPERTSGQTLAIGTPGYMPAEQSTGQPRFSSDIYALGMTAIHALTGVSPDRLQTDERGEVIWQHLASVSPGFAAILSKMTAYYFGDRYANAPEALQALTTTSPPTPAAAPVNPPSVVAATVAVGGHSPAAPRSPAGGSGSIPDPNSSSRWPVIAGVAIAGIAALALLIGLLPPLFRRASTPSERREVSSQPSASPSQNAPRASDSPSSTSSGSDRVPASSTPSGSNRAPANPTDSGSDRAPASPSDSGSDRVPANPTSSGSDRVPASSPPLPVPPSPRPPVPPSPRPQTQGVPAFPLDTARRDVEATLGQPTRDLRGAYGNTRAVVYNGVRDGVDLGYLFDRNSGRIRQTEASFRQSVNLPTAQQTLNDLLDGQAPDAVRQGLDRVYRRQLDNYRYQVGGAKVQIVRQDCGDIYVSIWDERLHDFVEFQQVRQC
ncbi:serine/threonine-protein kinase [Oscillatoria sp. FACHB-1406]|uniref:serine/threonine-protein kinase n=1 Tax=Oscillatoria sp. FACHB-1406 TaxID=2692846 RepID=UPI001684003A|nr:serine/threonine-protein kinase [Oscillatoria sp. FACHB-1406]MBD2577963.1 serine/threonine protein kinase [Oscillatoria sp. FACHB-1406]